MPSEHENPDRQINRAVQLVQYSQEDIEMLHSLPPEEQMKYILENLVQGRGQCTFVQSTEHFDPTTLNIENVGVSENDKGDILEYLTWFADYVNLPYIFDKFGNDHDARRRWRDQMDQAFGANFSDFYRENKLKWNKISNILSLLMMIDMIAGSDPSAGDFAQASRQLQRDVNALVQDEEHYSELSDEEKKVVTSEVSKKIIEFLNQYTRKTE